MKNIDKIRQMNSEELAEWREKKKCLSCSFNIKNKCTGFSSIDCKFGIVNWLEQEVEE